MRPLLIGIALFSTSAILFAACSQDSTGTTSTSTSTSTTSGTSGTGGAPNCEGIYFVDSDKDGGHPCDICLHDNCCAEAADCRDEDCIECVNYLLPKCGPKPRAVSKCLYTYCQPICSPGWAPTSTSTSG